MVFPFFDISPYNFFLVLSIVVYFFASLWLSFNYKQKYYMSDKYALPSVKQSLICLFLLVLFGFYGARLGHLLLNPHEYQNNFLIFLSLYPTRLVSWGSFLGLCFVPLVVHLFFKLNALRSLDMFILFVPLQISIRRIGCVIEDCCKGIETRNSFICFFRHEDVAAHPFALYIVLICLVIFVLLILWARKLHQPGTVLTWFFVMYTSARFVVEFFRAEQMYLYGLNKAQIVCVVLLPLFFLLHLILRRSSVKRRLL